MDGTISFLWLVINDNHIVCMTALSIDHNANRINEWIHSGERISKIECKIITIVSIVFVDLTELSVEQVCIELDALV